MLESMPEVGSELEAVRRQLERVLASPGFVRNERLSRFLRFIVEQHLEGKDSELKESVIALEVFGRPDHDPQQDSIVRNEASRLRARLGEYYLGTGKDDPFIIELPKGGYVPVTRSAGHSLRGTPLTAVPVSRFKIWTIGAVAAVLLVLTAAGWTWLRRPSAPIPIAVLPLANLNQDLANDFYADGLTGEIIRNLSIIEGLTVRSESSSFVFKGKPLKAQEAGRQLEADYLVEGSVLRSGQQLRISVQLVRANDDFPMWSGRYDRELTDIFAIQDEISRAIVNSLRLKLGRGRRRYETSTEAYDLYLRARAQRGKTSIPVFEQALAKDPSFAPAYAGLAVAYLIVSGADRNNLTEVAKMRAAAEKAIQLDPVLAEAYDALGAADAREAHWRQSEKSFRRSMDIQPGRPESHGYFAIFYLLPLGRIDEAIQQLRIAQNSDPLFTFFLADALADKGRNEEASAICNKLQPDSQCLPGALVRLGKTNEVIQNYAAHPENPAWVKAALACAYAQSGRRADAKELAVESGQYQPQAFACLGDKDGVFESLDRMAVLGPIRIGWFLLRADRESPGLLSGDPRLKALRKKVGLPE